jgi:hypothetical protein
MRSGCPITRFRSTSKFIEPVAGDTGRIKYDQFTAIDDCTRLRALRVGQR